jgi:hypothetical protein
MGQGAHAYRRSGSYERGLFDEFSSCNFSSFHGFHIYLVVWILGTFVGGILDCEIEDFIFEKLKVFLGVPQGLPSDMKESSPRFGRGVYLEIWERSCAGRPSRAQNLAPCCPNMDLNGDVKVARASLTKQRRC